MNAKKDGPMQLQMTKSAACPVISQNATPGVLAEAAMAEVALCADMMVLTLAGEIAASDLLPGARIITRDSGVVTLRAVTFSRVTAEVIRFKAGSLGHTRPDRDTLTLPGTLIHLRDWRAQAMRQAPAASIAAQDLVDGEFVASEQATIRTVVTLFLDRPHVIYADGLEIAASA